tara:strand:+ start:16239 stop:18113 length:1875 start_codon:yes stop_codon:yes gene_type:complete
MGDLTEEEFNSLPADSNGQMSEADFNALPSEPAQQVAPVEQPSGTVDKFFKNLRRVQTDTFDKMYGVKEPDKNMLLGFSGRGEEAAAGVAGMLGFHSQPWQEKIDRQNQWMSENTGTGIGKAAADTITALPAMYAAPEVAGGALMKPLAQIGQDMGLAGITGAMTHPGDAWDRLSNGAIDAAGAGLFSTVGQVAKPVVKYLGGAARTVHDIFTDSGHMSKLADYVRQAVPEDAIQTVVSNLENYKKLIPGYKPTAAEAGQHYGLNTLQDYFSNVNPGQYISRELDNIGAESKLMNAVADPKKLAEKIRFRTAETEPLYAAARQSMVPVDKELVQLLKRPEMRKAINEAITTGANNGISPPTRAMLNQVLSGRNSAQISGDALHHVKLGIDSLIKDAKDPRANLNQDAFKDIRNAFQDWRTKNMPDYAQAQSKYRQLSRPVNRRNAAQEIIDKVYPHGTADQAALHRTDPLKLGDIIADPDKLVQAGTDFKGSTYDNTFTNRQKDLMSNVSESQRRRAASELTSGTGFQHEVGGGMESRGVGAVAQAVSGIPGIYQGVTAKLLSEMTGQNRSIQSKLADILLDPKQTAALFKVGKRPHAMAFMDNSVLNKIPGLVGYLSANQYAN